MHDQQTLDGDSFPANWIEIARLYGDLFGLERIEGLAVAKHVDNENTEALMSLSEVDEQVSIENYDHDYDLAEDVQATEWAYWQCPELGGEEPTLERAMDYAPLITHLGVENLDPRMLENVDNPRIWMHEDNHHQPTFVHDVGADEKLLTHVCVTEDTRAATENVYISKWGDVYDSDMYEYVASSSTPMYGEMTFINPDEYDYDHPPVVHRESFGSHRDVWTFVDSDGEREKFETLDGVVRTQYWRDDCNADLTDEQYETHVRPILNHDGSELSCVSSGWHSSMEPSDQSEAVKAIQQGKLHGDDPEAWNFPVMIKTGTTNNVCSVSLSVYAPEEHHETVESAFDGSAEPYYAGL